MNVLRFVKICSFGEHFVIFFWWYTRSLYLLQTFSSQRCTLIFVTPSTIPLEMVRYISAGIYIYFYLAFFRSFCIVVTVYRLHLLHDAIFFCVSFWSFSYYGWRRHHDKIMVTIHIYRAPANICILIKCNKIMHVRWMMAETTLARYSRTIRIQQPTRTFAFWCSPTIRFVCELDYCSNRVCVGWIQR